MAEFTAVQFQIPVLRSLFPPTVLGLRLGINVVVIAAVPRRVWLISVCRVLWLGVHGIVSGPTFVIVVRVSVRVVLVVSIVQ